MSDRTLTPSLRCAPLARAAGYRPAGTAASARAFVLVETPLPWPHDVADHPRLRPLAPVLAAHGARLQAVVPASVAGTGRGSGNGASEDIRIVVYRQPDTDGTAARPYVRRETVANADGLAGATSALLSDTTETVPDGLLDVLVCTHGSRDVCCGKDGIGVHRELVALDLPGVRVWRTSHTGGHRFAPTAITFPDGRAWASVDAELLAGIVRRSVDPAVAARHDRGGAALPDPFTQAADGAVLGVEGWRWLDRTRTAETVDVATDGRRTVVLTGSPPPVAVGGDGGGDGARGSDGAGEGHGAGDGESLRYRAEVVVRREVPVPDCGRPLEEARKTSTEVEVVALDRIPPLAGQA
jgi:hypothetical protein